MQNKTISKIWAYDLLKAPHVTEKSSVMAKTGRVVLKVDKNANKSDIKAACELVFEEEVAFVNTMNTKPRLRGFKGVVSRRKSYKKAIVQFKNNVNVDKMVGNQ